LAQQSGKALSDLDLSAQEILWQQAKTQEAANDPI
jgi:hypothetical protein